MAKDQAIRNQYVLQIKSPDQTGIVAAIAPLLAEHGCDIREAGVYGDPLTETFFIRMRIASTGLSLADVGAILKPVAEDLELEWTLHDLNQKMKVLIAVSKFDHCLLDLVHKWRIGSLPIDIVGVVSNHATLRYVAEQNGLPYHHLPISKATKPQQEAAFSKIISDSGAELTVLARYMQILSDGFSAELSGKCINIHHSFLPSFKGAKPYHQAHARGVKLIGATAHYVTADLDEGPIIEQDVRRVNHSTTAKQMVEIGREVESSVLSRAIKWHAEHRVILNGSRTVVMA